MKSRSWTQRYVLWMVFPFGRPQGCYLVPTLRWLKHLLLLLYCFLTIWATIYRRQQHLQNLSETLLCFQAKNFWRKIIGEWKKKQDRQRERTNQKFFKNNPPTVWFSHDQGSWLMDWCTCLQTFFRIV